MGIELGVSKDELVSEKEIEEKDDTRREDKHKLLKSKEGNRGSEKRKRSVEGYKKKRNQKTRCASTRGSATENTKMQKKENSE